MAIKHTGKNTFQKIGLKILSDIAGVRRNWIIWGCFIAVQGIVMAVTLGKGIYPLVVGINIMMTILMLSDDAVRIFGNNDPDKKKLPLGVIISLTAVILLTAFIIMLISGSFRAGITTLWASILAVVNGVINIFRSFKYEKNANIRIIILILSIIFIGFGIAYWMTYKDAPELLTMARGEVLIIIGLISIWFGFRRKNAPEIS